MNSLSNFLVSELDWECVSFQDDRSWFVCCIFRNKMSIAVHVLGTTDTSILIDSPFWAWRPFNFNWRCDKSSAIYLCIKSNALMSRLIPNSLSRSTLYDSSKRLNKYLKLSGRSSYVDSASLGRPKFSFSSSGDPVFKTTGWRAHLGVFSVNI